MQEPVPYPLLYDWNAPRLALRECWLWGEVAHELDGLIEVAHLALRLFDDIGDGGPAIDPAQASHPLRSCGGYPVWAHEAALGMRRSVAAIHEHLRHHEGYAQTARSLWTTRIPAQPPTFSDAHILGVLALLTAEESADAFSELVIGIEEEIDAAGLSADQTHEIGVLRSRVAGWERQCWIEAVRRMGEAEKFLIMALHAEQMQFSPANQELEHRLTQSQQRLERARERTAAFRQGRPKGAVSAFSRFLMAIIKEAESKRFGDIVADIEGCIDETTEGILIQEVSDERIYYVEVARGKEKSLSLNSLRVRLQQLKNE